MNCVSFYGGESTGSVAKRNLNNTNTTVKSDTTLTPTLQEDTVSFRGNDDRSEKKSSVIGTIAKLAVAAGVLFGGLGYAHKAGWVEKLGEGKIKNIANKVTEPCHDGCRKIKGWANDGWTWVKGLFGGKKEA